MNDPLVQLGWVRTSTKERTEEKKEMVVKNGKRKMETLDDIQVRLLDFYDKYAKPIAQLKKLVVVNGVRKPETLDAVISKLVK